jgi:hypothetical protein
MRKAEGERAYIEGWRGVVRELGGLAPFPSGSLCHVCVDVYVPTTLNDIMLCMYGIIVIVRWTSIRRVSRYVPYYDNKIIILLPW